MLNVALGTPGKARGKPQPAPCLNRTDPKTENGREFPAEGKIIVKEGPETEQEKDRAQSKVPTKKELGLDALGVILIDLMALAGIVAAATYVGSDPTGSIALMAIFALWGGLYTLAVIAEDRKNLRQSRKATA